MAQLREKYGPNWGIKDPGAKRQPTKQEARDELIAQIGQKAFDAIPEGKDRTDAHWKKIAYNVDRTDWVAAEWPPGRMPESEVGR